MAGTLSMVKNVCVRALLVLAFLSTISACASRAGHHVVSTDPFSRAALLRVAQRFNDNYDSGRFGAVWDRWDRRSRAIIGRAEYIRRHEVCAPATGAVAKVEGATPAGHGAWHVQYVIDHVQLVDTWYFQRGRWVFDIAKSNPKAAKQYAMPFAKYAKAVGCTVH